MKRVASVPFNCNSRFQVIREEFALSASSKSRVELGITEKCNSIQKQKTISTSFKITFIVLCVFTASSQKKYIYLQSVVIKIEFVTSSGPVGGDQLVIFPPIMLVFSVLTFFWRSDEVSMLLYDFRPYFIDFLQVSSQILIPVLCILI